MYGEKTTAMNTYQARNVRCFVVVGVMLPLLVLVMLMWPRSDNSQPSSIRKKKALDLSTLDLTEDLIQKLAEEKLVYNKSRGATIFTTEDGSIRIPSDFVLKMMAFRDLEELYHRYLESIQTICHNQLHFGKHEDGGYDLCLDQDVVPRKPCLVYSFGVRDDFSFDDEVSRAFGCEVHSFDPANGMEDHAHSPTVFFHALGLGDFNGILNNMKLKTASSIKQELGHSERKIDVMKIDIEAGEWPALPEMLASSSLKEVKQLIIEFHSWVDLLPWNIDHRNEKDYRQHLKVLRDLYDDGYRIFFFKRFPAKCCLYEDEFDITRVGCHEVHLMRVDQ